MNYEVIQSCFRQNFEKSILEILQKILGNIENIILQKYYYRKSERRGCIKKPYTTLIAESYQSQRGSERKKLNTFMPKEYNIVFYRETHRCCVYATKRLRNETEQMYSVVRMKYGQMI